LLVGDYRGRFLPDSRGVGADRLDHARSLEEAKEMLQQRTYGLVLFEHATRDAEAVHFVAKFLHAGISVPFVLLTEEADEKTVAEIIEGGTWNCMAKSQLDGATLVRTMRNTLALHWLQQEQQTAEESVRKLSRAVDHKVVDLEASFLQKPYTLKLGQGTNAAEPHHSL
jgi:DNA-binding NtrC family response regulator